jgi:hypothetical protein
VAKRKKNKAKRVAAAAPPASPVRAEQEVFDDLHRLCRSPGFVHALAFLCFSENTVGIGETLRAEDLLPRYSPDRLIRNELSTLMGLLVRGPIDFSVPNAVTMEKYLDGSKALLEELHVSMLAPWKLAITPELIAQGADPFNTAESLREPIFYSAESAYSFQYRDLAPRKYGADTDWLRRNKGFSPEDARAVLNAVLEFVEKQHLAWPPQLIAMPPDEWTVLPAYCASPADLAEAASLPVEGVEAVLSAFTYDPNESNSTFVTLSDFNAVNAYPILRAADGKFIIMQYQALAEAVYDTPFYWMAADKEYANVALKNRGDFAEDFAEERFCRVFDDACVYRGVRIEAAKGKLVGEIDTLVTFGDHNIVLQAKAKRLTIEARKGNDRQLKDDFKKAVQDAAAQARTCANALRDDGNRLLASSGEQIFLASAPKRILPICIVSDHYPALSFQARQFLTGDTDEIIAPPLVTDVFALDAITEMLTSPLRLLSYLELRARFGDRMLASHELTLLSYHLRRNLWVDDQYTMMALEDDVAADLDVAMAVRREGLPGADTPPGILTKFRDTPYSGLIEQIETNPHPAAVSLGLLLLELSEPTIEKLNAGITQIVATTANDGVLHDFSCAFARGTGLTIHCNAEPEEVARARLGAHAASRKYVTKSESWIGVLLAPDGMLRGALRIEYPWKQDAKMDEATATMRQAAVIKAKPGRNSLCPCGSGKKYKKCCLP